MNKEYSEGAKLLLLNCGSLNSQETVSIIYDKTTQEVAKIVINEAKSITANVIAVETAPLNMHGEEPSEEAVKVMTSSNLCLGLTAKSMAHTKARQNASSNGCRYLSLPDYSLDLLKDKSLRANFQKQAEIAKRFADAFTKGNEVSVSTDLGTEIKLNIEGRVGNCCPGFVINPGELGSPPDIEANVSPLEDFSEGKVYVDGSIPYPSLGLLEEPVILTVRKGKITDIKTNSTIKRKLENLFETVGSDKVYVLAECGVGLNDLAELTGCMLTDEGTAGTMHFGFGSNSTVGGLNEVSFHLDFVFTNPTMKIDGQVFLNKGKVN